MSSSVSLIPKVCEFIGDSAKDLQAKQNSPDERYGYADFTGSDSEEEDGQSVKELVINPRSSHSVRPVILLETMNKWALAALLLIIALLAVAHVTIICTQHLWVTIKTPLPSYPCSPTQSINDTSGLVSCSFVEIGVDGRVLTNQTGSAWRGFGKGQGPVGLQVGVVRPGTYSSVDGDVNVEETISYELHMYNDIAALTSPVFIIKSEFTLRCEAGRPWCDRVTIASRTLFDCKDAELCSMTGHTPGKTSMIVISFSSPLLAYGDTNFEIIEENPLVHIMTKVLAGIATAAGLCMLVVWIARNRKHRRNFIRWLPERHWITFHLTAATAGQAAVWSSLLQLFGYSYFSIFLDCLIEAMAFAMCQTIWLMLIDGMRFHKAHVYNARFYMFKLPFGIVLMSSYFLLFLFTHPFINRIQGFKIEQTTMQVVAGMAGACTFIMAVWLSFCIWRTLRTLRNIPYLSNRHRQLAFRFFFLQIMAEGVALFIILIFTALVPVDEYGSSFGANVSRFVLMWSVILDAVIYLPVSERQMAAYIRAGGTFQFDLQLAKFYLDWSNWAYYELPGTEGAEWIMPEDVAAKVLKRFDVQALDIYAYLVHDDDKYIVVFRGSISKVNLLTDFTAVQTPWHFSANVLPRGKRLARRGTVSLIKSAVGLDETDTVMSIMVHKGFMDAWSSIRDELLLEVLKLNTDRVHVTGHSMGGALGNLCAYELAALHHKDITMYTFAQPRVGNSAFALHFGRAVHHAFRIVNDGDFITGLFKFKWWRGMRYKHVGVKAVIDGCGDLIIDPSLVESLFKTRSNRKVRPHLVSNYLLSIERCIAVRQKVATSTEADGLSCQVTRELSEDKM